MDFNIELEMKTSCRGLRLLLLCEFRLDPKAMKAVSNICGMMGKNVLFIRTAQHCSHRSTDENFKLNDLHHTGRPLQVNMGLLK